MLRTTPLSVGAGAAENSMLLKYGQPVASDSSIKDRAYCIDQRQQCRLPRRGRPATSESGGRPHLTPFALPSDLSALTVPSRSFSAQTIRKGGKSWKLGAETCFGVRRSPKSPGPA